MSGPFSRLIRATRGHSDPAAGRAAGPVADGDLAEISRRIDTLPGTGLITDRELASIGVTRDQLNHLLDQEIQQEDARGDAAYQAQREADAERYWDTLVAAEQRADRFAAPHGPVTDAYRENARHPDATPAGPADPWRPPPAAAALGEVDLHQMRAVIADLPAGPITDRELAQVGVTADEFDQLIDADTAAGAEPGRAAAPVEAQPDTRTALSETAAERTRACVARTDDALRACDQALGDLAEADTAQADHERAAELARRAAEERLAEAEAGLDREV